MSNEQEIKQLVVERLKTLPDNAAEIFLEPASQVMISLLKNHSPQEAHINSKKSFACQARKLLTSSATSLESSAVKYLIWNMQHQVCVEK